MVRAHPSKPDTWNPAIERGHEQVTAMRKQNRDDDYIATMLYQTCHNVPTVHFQKFLDELAVKYRMKH